MTNTTYYNLNIVEGSDIVNPLTVDNPNYEKIDETMHNNAVSGVTLATEIANATVHAITRENSECTVIRFIATSVWKAGDTITVDSVPVTALLPSGETLPDGAYVINANVLCILTGTNLTVFAERKKTDNANDIKYNETNVGAELDTVNNNLSDVTSKLAALDYLKNIKNVVSVDNPSSSTKDLRIWHSQKYGSVLYFDSMGNMALIPISWSNNAYVGTKTIIISGSVTFNNMVDYDENSYIRFDVPTWCMATAILFQ